MDALAKENLGAVSDVAIINLRLFEAIGKYLKGQGRLSAPGLPFLTHSPDVGVGIWVSRIYSEPRQSAALDGHKHWIEIDLRGVSEEQVRAAVGRLAELLHGDDIEVEGAALTHLQFLASETIPLTAKHSKERRLYFEALTVRE